MTITINPVANQSPFTNANLSQSNSGTCAVDSNGYAFQSNNSTANIVYGNATFSPTQSCQATIRTVAGIADLSLGVDGAMQLLYTDANNRAFVSFEYNGTNNTFARLSYYISGSRTDVNFATGLSDTWATDGDALLVTVTWSGADATFELKKNGVTVGSTVTRTSFGLTSGVPGFNLERNSSGFRAVGFSQLVLTGESGSGIVSIKGNRGPRVAFGSARVGF